MYSILNNQTLRRLDKHGVRFYYDVDTEHRAVKWLPSVTSIIKNTSPTPHAIIKWTADLGEQRAKQVLAEKANYGTLLHLLIEKFMDESRLDLAGVKQAADDYCKERKVWYNTEQWAEDLCKDLAAFAEFVADYNVRPIANELMVSNHRYAGCVDLVCYMDIDEKGYFGEVYKSGENKGMPKETKIKKTVVAIVDFKSGRHGFYDEHRLQLFMYKRLVDLRIAAQAPHLGPVEALFNWSPKDWTGETATYNLKRWLDDDGTVDREIDLVLDLYELRNPVRPAEVTQVKGMLLYGLPAKDNVTKISMDDIVFADMDTAA